jgi:hypothetical protein
MTRLQLRISFFNNLALSTYKPLGSFFSKLGGELLDVYLDQHILRACGNAWGDAFIKATVALDGYMLLAIGFNGAERTTHNAHPAPNAPVVIGDNMAIVIWLYASAHTGRHTWRFLAVAADYGKVTRSVIYNLNRGFIVFAIFRAVAQRLATSFHAFIAPIARVVGEDYDFSGHYL